MEPKCFMILPRVWGDAVNALHSIKEERGELSQVTGNFTPPEQGYGGESTDGVSIIRIPTDGQVMYQNHVGEHRTQFYNSYKSDCVDMWRPRVDTRFIHFSAPIVQTPRRVHLVFAPINNSPDSESWVLFKLLLCVHQLAIYNVILLFEVAHALLTSVEKSVSPVPMFPNILNTATSSDNIFSSDCKYQVVGGEVHNTGACHILILMNYALLPRPGVTSPGVCWSSSAGRHETTTQSFNIIKVLEISRSLLKGEGKGKL